MTRGVANRPELYDLAHKLRGEGLTVKQVAEQVRLPYSTVKEWLGARGRRPGNGFDGPPIQDLVLMHPSDIINSTEAYAYVLGLYLGDGYISRCPRTFQMRIYQDGAHMNLAELARQELKRAVDRFNPSIYPPETTSTIGNCAIISVHSQLLPVLFPQHGPGRKSERAIQLEQWQKDITSEFPGALVRGLIHSDGCRYINRVTSKKGKTYSYPSYDFSNRSEDIHLIFAEHCALIGVACRRSGVNSKVTRKEAVAILDHWGCQKQPVES